MTPIGASYDAIYLCSALVLEEFRRKGIAKQLALKAIEDIRKDYPVKALFVWTFTRKDISLLNLLPGLLHCPCISE